MNSIAFALIGLGSYMVLAGLVAIYVGIKRAPMGFENERGFHWGEQPDSARDSLSPATLVRLPAHAGRSDERLSA